MGHEHDHDTEHDHEHEHHDHGDEVSPTDMTPKGPKGVGEGQGPSYGDDEANRPSTDDGDDTRPAGTSEPSDWTGVGQHPPIDEESPNLTPS